MQSPKVINLKKMSTVVKNGLKNSNMKFMQARASADIFSLGLVLLQIATGIPSQCDLPIKLRCQTIKNKHYHDTAHFGLCDEGLPFEQYA